jgi:hypothetical protein
MKVSSDNETGFRPVYITQYIQRFSVIRVTQTTLDGALSHVNCWRRCQRLDVTNG